MKSEIYVTQYPEVFLEIGPHLVQFSNSLSSTYSTSLNSLRQGPGTAGLDVTAARKAKKGPSEETPCQTQSISDEKLA